MSQPSNKMAVLTLYSIQCSKYLYKKTKFATFTRSQIFSGGALFYKPMTCLQLSAQYIDDVCSLLIGHSKRLYLMYAQLVIFQFFPSSFPAFFPSFEGRGVVSIHLGYKRTPKNIPNEEGRVGHQILHELPV